MELYVHTNFFRNLCSHISNPSEVQFKLISEGHLSAFSVELLISSIMGIDHMIAVWIMENGRRIAEAHTIGGMQYSVPQHRFVWTLLFINID